MGHVFLPEPHQFANRKSSLMTNSLTIPRSATWDVLRNSRNLAAITTLSTGLLSSSAELRHLCLKTLLARGEEQAKRAIVLAWENFNEADLELLRSKGTHFVGMAEALLSSGSLAEKRMALSAISDLDLNDSIDVVLEIVVDSHHALSSKATECLLQMCERWGAKARQGKDVPTIRGKMLEQIHAQLAVFQKHKNFKLVDAWLSLVHWDDSLQRSLISDPRQDAYRAVLSRMRESQQPAVYQLLAGYLSRSATPKNVLEILSERSEAALAVAIAQLNDKHTLPGMLKRLRSMAPLQCLTSIECAMPSVGGELERRLWLMVASSTSDMGQVLRGALRLAKLGTREARQTASEMLRSCRRPGLEELVPAIQAAEFAASQDELCLGNLMRELTTWLTSPSLVLKKAARDFFKDFTVENLLEQARHWPTEMCRAMASIVLLTETDIAPRLTRELQSPAPRRRLAALQVVQLLSCVDQVSQTLMPLLDDPRLEVRVRTIDLLGALGHEALEQLIPALIEDASTDIQDAAHRAVRRIKRFKHENPQPTQTAE